MIPEVCAAVLLAAASPTATEVRWAKGATDDFWAAAFALKYPAAIALFAPEYRETLTGWAEVGSFDSVRFDGAEVSPIRGTLPGKKLGLPGGEPISGRFTMRVVKGVGGQWAIRYLRVKDDK